MPFSMSCILVKARKVTIPVKRRETPDAIRAFITSVPKTVSAWDAFAGPLSIILRCFINGYTNAATCMRTNAPKARSEATWFAIEIMYRFSREQAVSESVSEECSVGFVHSEGGHHTETLG